MGGKILWTGLTIILAVSPVLVAFGFSANNAVILIGAIVMIIGLILMWLDK